MNFCRYHSATLLNVLLLLGFGLAASAFAHDPGLSTASVQVRSDKLEVTVTLSLKDAGVLVNLDADRDGRLAPNEVAAGEQLLRAMGSEALEVTLDGCIARVASVRCQFDGNSNATLQLEIPASQFSTLHIRARWLAQLPPGHRQFLSVQDQHDTVLARKLLSAEADFVSIELNHLGTKPTNGVIGNLFSRFVAPVFTKRWLPAWPVLIILFAAYGVLKNPLKFPGPRWK